MLKDTIRKQTVWFKANEELEVLNWLAKEINVPLSPNMAIRYLCMKALQDKTLRTRATERINLMFEELRPNKKHFVKCCASCDFEDEVVPLKGPGIKHHRVSCKLYSDEVKQRMERLMIKEKITA